MNQLLTSGIWPKIKKLGTQARRIQAAIAYFSSDRYFTLKRGDSLVTNASVWAIKNGETSAKVLWKLFKKGVVIRSSAKLHAKLIILDDKVLIGSANASQNSVSLYEAAVITDFPAIVSQSKSFLFQLEETLSPLTKGQLQKLLKIKVIRRGGQPKGRRKKRLVATGEATWIVSTEDLDDDAFPEEEGFVEQAERQIKRTHPDANPGYIRWTGNSRFQKSAKNGDFLVIIEKKDGRKKPYGVHTPTTLLRRQKKGRWTRFYYDSNPSYPKRGLTWKQFQTLLKKVPVGRRITTGTIRALTHPEALSLEAHWPRRRRRGR